MKDPFSPKITLFPELCATLQALAPDPELRHLSKHSAVARWNQVYGANILFAVSLRLISLLFASLFISTTPAHAATTYYVAKSGSDSVSCSTAQNQNTPRGTINGGISCLNGGDTLIVKSGTYNEAMQGEAIPSGSSGNPTVVKSEVSRGAVLQPTNQAIVTFGNGVNQHWIVFDGFVLDAINNTGGAGGLVLTGQSGSDDITLTNVEIKNTWMLNDNNAGNCAISWGYAMPNTRFKNGSVHDIGLGSQNNTQFWAYGIYGLTGIFENNEMYNVTGYAIHQYSSSGSYDNTIIRNNIFRDTGTVLVNCGVGGVNNKVYNNILVRVGTTPAYYDRQGFRVCGSGVEVYNNTIVNGGSAAEPAKSACVALQGSGNTARNNICWQNAADSITGTGNTVDHNLLGQNPLFVNSSPNVASDFKLQSGSPAIGQGSVLNSVFTADYANVTRGTAWDIGAYEFSGSALPTVTIVATDASASEPGSNTGTFTFTRTGSTSAALTVNYSFSGTAVNGTDYSTITTSITIPAGSASATRTITPLNDTVFEPTEAVTLTLLSNAAYSVGAQSSATVNITDDDGSGGTLIPQSALSLVSVDSEETAAQDGRGVNVLDGNSQTLWHTAWSQSSPPPPHTLIVATNATYSLQRFQCLPRQDGSPNGTIKDYQFYTSMDGSAWTVAASGTFTPDTTLKEVSFGAVNARYVKLVALSEINNQNWTSMAEFNLFGSLTGGGGGTPFVTGQTLGTPRNNYTGAVGFKFTVGASAMRVSELGRWIVSGNTGTHTVKLVVAGTGADVSGGSVSIATAGAPAGQFKYGSLASPVTLSANTAYYLVSLETNLADSWYNNNTTLTHTSEAAINASVFSPNPSNGPWTLAGSTNNSYVPVSFKTQVAAPGETPFVTGQTLGTLRNNFTGAAGFKLTVGSSPMTVTKLGRWIVSGNTGTHAVKLVAATSGADLNGGAVSVATSGAPAGQFKYVALASPVTLSANTAYYIVSLETNLGDSWYNWNTTLTHTSQAVINNSVYSANPANGPWTLSGAANYSYVPVSFMTSP